MAISPFWPRPAAPAIYHPLSEADPELPELVSLARTEFYQVVPGQPVTLEVIAADGLNCRTCLLLNGQPFRFAHEPGPQTIGANLAGSILHVRTVVTTVQPELSATGVIYELKGGSQTSRVMCSIRAGATCPASQYIVAFVFTDRAG